MYRKTKIFFLLLLIFNESRAVDLSTDTKIEDNASVVHNTTETIIVQTFKPSEITNPIGGVERDLFARYLVYGISALVKNDAEGLCHKQLREFKMAMDLQLTWAIKVLDSSGAKPPGYILGDLNWIGSKEACLESMNLDPLMLSEYVVQHEPTPFDAPPFDVNFAVAYFLHNNTLQFHGDVPGENMIRIGMCVPASCKEENLTDLITEYISTGAFTDDKVFNLNLNYQRTKVIDYQHEWIFDPTIVGILIAFGVTISLVIIGTIYDIMNSPDGSEYAPPKPGLLGEMLLCFSVIKNGKVLLETKQEGGLSMLHGLRFLSMVWVTLAHSGLYELDFIDNIKMAYRFYEPFANQPLTNMSFSVDTFFVISGFLMSYLFCKSKIKVYAGIKGPGSILRSYFEWSVMIINRFLRLTPVYVYSMGLVIVVSTYSDKESSFKQVEENHVFCKEYWWRNLLYINNFYPSAERCMSWSWYLSCDMQLFFVASIILVVSLRFLVPSLLTLVALMIFQMCFTTYVMYSKEFTVHIDRFFHLQDVIYDIPWHRMGSYIIGLLAGFLYSVKLQEKLVLGKASLLICWTIFPACSLWAIYGIYQRDFPKEYCAIYFGISRPFFSLGVAWLIIACLTDNAGLINKFLSQRFWMPLSRLSYTAYLVNAIVIFGMHSAAEVKTHSSVSFCILEFGATLSCTLLFSIPFSLCFEAPFVRLSKFILDPLMGKNRPRRAPSADTKLSSLR